MINENDKELRTDRFEIKLTPTERGEWELAASKLGLPLSDFVRLVIRQKISQDKQDNPII